MSCLKGTLLSKVDHIFYSVATALFKQGEMSLRQLTEKTSKCSSKALFFFMAEQKMGIAPT